MMQISGLGEKLFSVRWGEGIPSMPQAAAAFVMLYILTLLVMGVIILAYRIFLTVLVTRDAQKRGGNSPLWATLALLFGSCAVMPYLLMRKDVTEVKKDV